MTETPPPNRAESSQGDRAGALRREVSRGKKKAEGESFGEIVRTIFYALMIALVFRVVFFQPFSIPSGSMKSTLLIGDYLFVSKYAYGYSRYSLPFSPPLFEGRLFGRAPERGDVIVFRGPRSPSTDYIKRLVGLPGDQLQMKQGVLHINGAAVKLERDGVFLEPLVQRGQNLQQGCMRHEVVGGETMCAKDRFIETLPNGVRHIILNIDQDLGSADNTGVYAVPAGHYFFMGDNRDNSGDSRNNFGFVPEENLIGRAELIFLSSDGLPIFPWNWRFDRFFKIVE